MVAATSRYRAMLSGTGGDCQYCAQASFGDISTTAIVRDDVDFTIYPSTALV
jgi:hypothetical protein